jgi:hypothetical protein
MQPIFAFDFSCNKPALCISIDGNISYAVFPSKVDKITEEKLNSVNVEVFNRNLEPISKNSTLSDSDLIIEQVSRAKNLANMIVSYIMKKLSEIQCPVTDAIIANEGFSFASSGNAVLDLSGYKYILMSELIDKGFKDFRTYAPITIKKTAECSKKGMGKEDMIQAAGNADCEHPFNKAIINNPESLKKKTAWVACVDDLADAYWCMRTVLRS